MAIGSLVSMILAFTAAPSILNAMGNLYPPYPTLLARTGYSENPDLIPTVEQLIRMRWREAINHETYLYEMSQAGLSNDRAEKLWESTEQLLTPYEYVTLWRRDKLTAGALETHLSKLGLSLEQQANLKTVSLYYPNPQDIVRFAVREVYNPTIVDLYGLDDDLPDDYLDAARKGGLSEEFAVNYWRQHWELPSPTQVFEMLHRRIIEDSDVADYLRAADYMPYWRDKLTAISYKPLTRVDVRRMHKMGVLDEEQVYNSYRDIGYDDTNAQLMTAFTVRYNEGTEGKAPSDDIIELYQRGVYERGQAEQLLSELQYPQSEIDVMLNAADESHTYEVLKLQADAISNLYRAGAINQEEMRLRLVQLNLPNRQIELIIEAELARQESDRRLPPKSSLDRWLQMGLIDQEEYIRRMQLMRYSMDDINLYLTEIAIMSAADDYKLLPRTTYVKLYKAGLMSQEELAEKLLALGYSPEDVTDLIVHAGG